MNRRTGSTVQRYEQYRFLQICFSIFLFCFAEIFSPAGCASPEASPEVGNNIRQRLSRMDDARGIRLDDEEFYVTETLEQFYQKRNYAPAWSGSGLHRQQIDDLIYAIEETTDEGLTPEYYHLANIRQLLDKLTQQGIYKSPNPADMAEIDLLLTDAFLSVACHLSGGCVNPVMLESEWHVKPENVDVLSVFEKAISENRIADSLLRLTPQQDTYSILKQQLRRYRTIAANGGWPEMPTGGLLKKGLQNKQITTLRERLAISGDLTGEEKTATAEVFDGEMEQAVIRFQERHGLQADGVVGPLTRKALNVPASMRAEQIRVNMERLRWISSSFGERYIYVNIADYKLEVIEHGQSVLSMRVVVGKPYWYTPVFNAKMTYLVVNPTWNVPESIVDEEVLPNIKKDPDYLAKQNIAVLRGWGEDAEVIDPATIDWQRVQVKGFPFHFLQEPGPLNPLGSIKFMFPNKFNVYLHDTPAQGYFAEGVRAFSHGCIRLEKPFELADYLLKDKHNSTKVNIYNAILGGKEQIIKLPLPIDIYIVYLTAWAGRDGELQFREDIYERDKRLGAALQKKPFDYLGVTSSTEELTPRKNFP